MHEEASEPVSQIVHAFWESETAPEEWEHCLLSILAKKGDLSPADFGVFETADENTRLKVRRLDQAARIETRRRRNPMTRNPTTRADHKIEKMRRPGKEHDLETR